MIKGFGCGVDVTNLSSIKRPIRSLEGNTLKRIENKTKLDVWERYSATKIQTAADAIASQPCMKIFSELDFTTSCFMYNYIIGKYNGQQLASTTKSC